MMKNISKILAITFVALVFGFSAKAQSSDDATGSASVVIVQPIDITNVSGLVFGNIVPDADGGTVVITPANGRTLNGLNAVTGAFNRAEFTVTGPTGVAYSIDITPDAGISIENSGGQVMTVDNWTSNPGEGATGSLATGTQTIYVGGTLNVAGNQAPGTYDSDTSTEFFTVTVSYN